MNTNNGANSLIPPADATPIAPLDAAPKITFRPVGYQHIPLLTQWLSEPHMKGIWDQEEIESILERQMGRIAAASVKQFIAFAGQSPFGYVQYYWASQVGGGWWKSIEDSCVGIDLYVGNPAFLGQGYGRALVSQFVQALWLNPEISRIIADPHPKNLKIQSLLTKLGFKNCGPIQTPDGDALLFELRRPAAE